MVSLADLKEHLRIDFDDEDGVLAIYLAAAEAQAMSHINLPQLPEGERPAAAFRAAVLLYAGDLYENRENAPSDKSIATSAAARLLDPYRKINI